MSSARNNASEGWTNVTGPGTFTGEWYGIFPDTDFVATSITAPGSKDYGGASGTMTNCTFTTGVYKPLFFKSITLPSGAKAWLQNVTAA